MRLCGRRYAGARRPSDEPDGTGGRLNGISRAHTAGRALDGTSGPGGELHGSSDVAGGELARTSDSSDEPERAVAGPITPDGNQSFFYLARPTGREVGGPEVCQNFQCSDLQKFPRTGALAAGPRV